MRKALFVFLILLGCAVLLYAPVSGWLEDQRIQSELGYLDELTARLDPSDYSAMREQAAEYNDQLWKLTSGQGISSDRENLLNRYEEILNVDDQGLIGRVEIPSIEVDLPIYHGEDEQTLALAVGHHPYSSFPVGTDNSRVMLTAHTGMAAAKLFTRLDELENGDVFFLDVLGETYAYEVFDTQVVLPLEVNDLKPEQGEDLVTLITCTPFGVNTHRLLVTGQRTQLSPEEMNALRNASGFNFSWHEIAFYILPAILVLIILSVLIMKKIRNRKGEKENDQEIHDNPGPGPGFTPPPVPEG